MREGKRIGKGIGYTVIFSIISFFFIFQVVAKISFRQSFQGMNWFFIGLGFGSLFMMWLAKALRMYSIGQGMGIPVGFWYYLQIYLATCFISHVTPFNAGGTPLQIYILHKKGVAVGQATALTAVDLGLNTLMFLVLIPLALWINLHSLHQPVLLQLQSLFPKFFMALCGFVLVWLVIRYTKLWWRLQQTALVRKLVNYIKRKGFILHFRREWEQFKAGWLKLFHQHPHRLLEAILASVLYWFFYLLLAPLIFWAMGRMISFFDLIGRQLLFNFAQVFVPTPGGSGGSELILVYMFKNVIGPARVGTFVLLWKIYTFFSTLLVGSFFFLKLTKKNRPG